MRIIKLYSETIEWRHFIQFIKFAFLFLFYILSLIISNFEFCFLSSYKYSLYHTLTLISILTTTIINIVVILNSFIITYMHTYSYTLLYCLLSAKCCLSNVTFLILILYFQLFSLNCWLSIVVFLLMIVIFRILY